MLFGSLLAVALSARYVNAMMRFTCAQLVTQRLDPLLNPGMVSPHLHQIVGGNAFNVTMDPNNDLPTMSTCTSCTFKEDASNYWTAVMYFKHPNGSYKRVPQMANQFLEGNGGMTVYYIPPYDNAKTTAFKRGFRMIVGDASLRAYNSSNVESRAISMRCFDANFGGPNAAPGNGGDTHDFPKKFCAGGIRTNIFFPTCWDGKNLDSPDHKSHIVFPSTANLDPVANPSNACPRSHPTLTPQVFLETIWDTRGFKDIWPKDGSNPLVFSMGDPTGYGHHADYVFGWKGDALQKAMDANCGPGPTGCSLLTAQSTAQINACTQSVRVKEPVDGWLDALPGCNPLQAGPGKAVVSSGCGATTEFTPGGPQEFPGSGGAPAVAPPATGGSPPATGGGTTPPFQGGTPPAVSPGTPPAVSPGNPPTTGGGGGATVSQYGQCGGNGYSGPTACASPYTCRRQNEWYSQCL